MDMELDQPKLIAEVKKRLGLWSVEHPTDRDQKLVLWKEIGAAMYKDWQKISKAKAYDRVLFLQRKWRSLRDAYRRELRAQSTGVRPNKTIYRYFRIMTFLGGIGGYSFPVHLMDHKQEEEEEQEEAEENNDDNEQDSSFDIDDEMVVEALDGEEEHVESFNNTDPDPLVTSATSTTTSKSAKSFKKRTSRLKSTKRKFDVSSIEDIDDHQELEMPVYSLRERDRESDSDSDRLFLMSFLPEMKQLPVNIKMWARAQIANIMQEAISCQYNNTVPEKEIKRQRFDSLE